MKIRLSDQILVKLSKPNTFISLFQIFLEYFAIFSIMFFTVKLFNIFTVLLAIILIGARIHSLSAIAHDSVHYRICRNKRINEWIANIFLYFPMFSSQQKYRTRHLLHHKNNNTDDDPDYIYKKDNIEFKFPQKKTMFLKTVFKYVFGIHYMVTFLNKNKTFYDRIKYFLRGATVSRTLDHITYNNNKKEAIGITLFNGTLFFILLYFNWAFYYILFWILPIILYLPFVFRIRSICEHFGLTKTKIDDSRTMYPTLLDKIFFGFNWNLSYHLDHHLFPTVPSYNVKALHKELLKNKDYIENAQITKNGVYGVFKECTF